MTTSQITDAQRVCATCAKWCGTRDINLGRTLVILEHSGSSYSEVKAKCTERMFNMSASQSCSAYRKWDALN